MLQPNKYQKPIRRKTRSTINKASSKLKRSSGQKQQLLLPDIDLPLPNTGDIEEDWIIEEEEDHEWD